MTPPKSLGHRCPLQQLNIMELVGPLPGLSYQKGLCSMVQPMFTCCAGSGQRWDAQGMQINRCDLVGRLGRLNRLIQKYPEAWPQHADLLPGINSESEAKLKKWLRQCADGKESKGYCLKRQKNQPSLLWTFGAMAIWRFQWEVIWVNLGKTNLASILEDMRKIKGPAICLIEQNEPLWKHQYDLECLISWCENSAIPVWIDFLMISGETNAIAQKITQTDHNKAAIQHFSKRLTLIKQAPPLSWVDQFCQSRLKTVCHNGDGFG